MDESVNVALRVDVLLGHDEARNGHEEGVDVVDHTSCDCEMLMLTLGISSVRVSAVAAASASVIVTGEAKQPTTPFRPDRTSAETFATVNAANRMHRIMCLMIGPVRQVAYVARLFVSFHVRNTLLGNDFSITGKYKPEGPVRFLDILHLL